MRILVFGCGVIGSLLVHALCTAGNEVTVISRGRWKEVLDTEGLHLNHVIQKKETVDHPQVLEKVPEDGAFDLVFSAMRAGSRKRF